MNKSTSDEKQNKAVGEKVITPKRVYFLPFQSVSVEAADLADVEKQLMKVKELEVGDVNN